MKTMILGAPLTGKSTLARQLRAAKPQLVVIDYDEEVLASNDGVWPEHGSPLMAQLRESITESILTRSDAIFLCHELSVEYLARARDLGFIIYELHTTYEELERRNAERLKTEPWNDAFQFVASNLSELEKAHAAGLTERLDATQPTALLAQHILN